MDLLKAAKDRHAVRSYLDKPVASDLRTTLDALVDECNRESGLNIQIVWDEPKAFDSFMAHYGKFSGVTNYVALIGKKDDEEKIGYYGEKIALTAQALGLNTCWGAMSYKKVKSAYTLRAGEKLHLVLALGYGATQGVEHKSKSLDEVAKLQNVPAWFVDGVKCALLAPTAINQQKFYFALENGKVIAKPGFGFYTKADLGIAKFHFELGAGKQNVVWTK